MFYGKRPVNCNQLPDPDIWVDQYGDYLLRYTLLRLRDPELAKDAVQETLLAALHARDHFAGQSSERTWLVGILKHKIVDCIRKISRERPVEDVESLTRPVEEFFDETDHLKAISTDWTDDPGKVLERREFLEILERCLSKLPSRLSTAFALCEMDGLSGQEICKTLNISTTNLHVMLYRARTQLRHCLEINWFGSERG